MKRLDDRAPLATRRRRAAGRWHSVVALSAIGVCMSMSTVTAAASPSYPNPSLVAEKASDQQPPAALNTFVDPAVLESVQQSIVGVVTVWEEAEDPLAMQDSPAPGNPGKLAQPAVSICTGWFDSPTTIATAGHCVDPKLGREYLDDLNPPIDPRTGQLVPRPPAQPEPKRTVYAFQPGELPGAVLMSPVIVHVHSYRSAEDGDTAKLEIHGMPAARPLPIASTPPRLGEPVTSIGFAGLDMMDADGVDNDALFAGKSPAQILQESRLHPANTSGTITAQQFRQGVAVYQVSADFDHGMSGGPTINSRGEVYGINSQMTTPYYGQNFNIITDTAMLREFLGHDQPQTGAPQPDAAENPVSTVAAQPGRDGNHVVAIPAALVGLITGLGGVGIGWLVARRVRQSSNPATTAHAAEGEA